MQAQWIHFYQYFVYSNNKLKYLPKLYKYDLGWGEVDYIKA